MTAPAQKINISSIEYTKIARAASKAAAEEIQKIVDIRDALTPIKFLNRESQKNGTLKHLKPTALSVLKEVAARGSKSKGIATIRQKTLADKLHLSPSTILRTLAKLEESGIIYRKKTRTKTGKQGADVIVFKAFVEHMKGFSTPPKSPAEQPAECGIQGGKSESARLAKCHPFFTDRVDPDTEADQAGYDEYCEVADTAEPVPEKRPIQRVNYPKAATTAPELTAAVFAGNDDREHYNPGRVFFVRQPLTVLQGGLAHV